MSSDYDYSDDDLDYYDEDEDMLSPQEDEGVHTPHPLAHQPQHETR